MISLGRIGYDKEEEVSELAAISLAVALGEAFPPDTAGLEGLTSPSLSDFLPKTWRDKGDAASWARKLVPYHASLGVAAAIDDAGALGALLPQLQASFVEVGKHSQGLVVVV